MQEVSATACMSKISPASLTLYFLAIRQSFRLTDVFGMVIPARGVECQVPTLNIGSEKSQEIWNAMCQIASRSLTQGGAY
jgi:hypothetical protein